MARQPHVALLGDSVFDNGAYTSGAPDVAAHLRGLIAPRWTVSLLARDGATIAGLSGQLQHVPEDTSHLVISIGGNDALQNFDVLSLPVTSTAQALEALAARVSIFERAYREAITRALAPPRQTVICTIYNGALDQHVATAARMAVSLFNDAILRTAVDLRLDALELRSICTEAVDYANPIEPSGQGGLKIARAIAAIIDSPQRLSGRPAQVWGDSAK